MNRNTLIIIISGITLLLILIVVLVFNLNKSSNIKILSNAANIVTYKIINDNTIIYQTTENSLYKSVSNQPTLIFQYNPKNIVTFSPLGNYYSEQHDNEVTVYSLSQNQPISRLNASLFSWQKDDSYIYAAANQKTTNPALAVDYDVIIENNIYYVEKPGSKEILLDKKAVNSLVYYSNNPKVLYYMIPNTSGNSLQESILVKNNLPGTQNLSTYSNYLIKTFNDGVVINDSSAGNSIISDGVQFTNKNFTVQSGLQKINNKLSTLTLENKNESWYLNITGVEDGKTETIGLPLPREFNGKNLRNPTLYKSSLFFQSDSGIFSTNLGGDYAQ